MDTLSIKISPRVAEALAKSKNVVSLIEEFNGKLLLACSDGRISFDEVLSLIAQVVNLARQLSKK